MTAETVTPLAPPAPRPAPDVPAPARRFTIDGDDQLERHLAQTCAKIMAGLRGLLPEHKLEAVLLGGGYGRGEGGVLLTAGGHRPYNDLEFYVCLRGNRHWNERLYHRRLEILGEILTPQAGVELEFKIFSLAELARCPVTMFTYDLFSGHRWLFGHEGLLSRCQHHGAADKLPGFEATRLLMNRCTGLLLARERLGRSPLRFTPADADFVRRNIAKVELALGDAVLTAHGQYHWSCRERHARLLQLAHDGRSSPASWLDEVCAYHQVGTEFKLHPTRCDDSRDSLRRYHTEVTEIALRTWLWLESRRLDRVFRSALEYAESPAKKCGATSLIRNLMVNAKISGPRAFLARHGSCHPRQRVMHALALLLWEPDVLTSPYLLRRVQAELKTRGSSFIDLVAAYRALWQQVN
jgi:hypothetical protein